VRGGRVAIAAVLVVLLGLIFAGSALGCSCAPSTPAESLAASDAAITARLVAVEPLGASRAEYHYEALHVYRGRKQIERGDLVEVVSPRGSAACALPDRIGGDFGLFLLGAGGHWSSGLCGVVSPRRLALAARHAPLMARSQPESNCAS
jgi:hypothetical protein